MMKHRPITLLLILLLFIVFYGCEKHPFDYRNKFIGDYDFSVHKNVWDVTGVNIDTYYNYSGKISYGSGDDEVRIKFLDDTETQCQLFEDGSLKFHYTRGEFVSTKEVQFSSDYRSGGGGTQYFVSGKRIK